MSNTGKEAEDTMVKQCRKLNYNRGEVVTIYKIENKIEKRTPPVGLSEVYRPAACRTRRLIGGISYHFYVVWDVKEPLSLKWR